MKLKACFEVNQSDVMLVLAAISLIELYIDLYGHPDQI